MSDSELVARIQARAKGKMMSDPSGHDFYHAVRVANLCCYLARKTGADETICVLLGYLHDFCRPDELSTGLPHWGPQALEIIRNVLVEEGLDTERMEKILISVGEHENYPHLGAKSATIPESQILQDADRLDAMGAIGIARTFMFTGAVGGKMFNPDQEKENWTANTAIGYFHNMLLRLPESMYTNEAKEIAQQRQKLIKDYLDTFYTQWNFGAELLREKME